MRRTVVLSLGYLFQSVFSGVTSGVTLDHPLSPLFLISSSVVRLVRAGTCLCKRLRREFMKMCWHFGPNCNPLIWKQFKAFKHLGFLIIPSSCQAHSCLRPWICCPTVWTTLPVDHLRGCVPQSPQTLLWCRSHQLPLPPHPAPLLFLWGFFLHHTWHFLARRIFWSALVSLVESKLSVDRNFVSCSLP